MVAHEIESDFFEKMFCQKAVKAAKIFAFKDVKGVIKEVKIVSEL